MMLIFVSQMAFGQSSTGSSYNVFGLGTLTEEGGEIAAQLGNTGIAARPSGYVIDENPASLTAIIGPTQMFQMGLAYQSLKQSSSSESFTTSVGGIKTMQFWIRPAKNSGLLFGLKQFSDGRYDITDTYVASPIANSYAIRYQGTGGLTSFYSSFGYKLFGKVSLGVSGKYIFGNLSAEQTLYDNSYLENLALSQSNFVHKLTADFGSQVDLINRQKFRVTLGLVYRPAYNINFSSESKLIQNTSDSLTYTSGYSMKLPEKFGAGLELATSKLRFSLDAELHKWSVNPSHDNYSFSDQVKLSGSIAYQKDRLSMTYTDRIEWRFGYQFANGYALPGGATYDQHAVTTGLGLPVNGGFGQINLGYMYQTKGRTSDQLILEQTNTIMVSFNIRDLWFRKVVYD